jgi:glycosyltransferase involved in cell wall biosynthesis
VLTSHPVNTGKRAFLISMRCIDNKPYEPFFSLCIPQHNRTDFLIKACEGFSLQIFLNFEICISDDCSNDGKEKILIEYLKNSGLNFTYKKVEHNLEYDANLRRSIVLSKGRYIWLMGNDDGLSDVETLQAMHDEIIRNEPISVAITNYRDFLSGRIYRRMTKTGVIGSGPATAASTFRNYSFLSGIILKGDEARAAASDAYDGSEMYQMYLGTRLVAAGGRLLAIDRVCVDKDLQIPGQFVDSYRLKPRLRPCPVVERPLPMGRLLDVVAGGLDLYQPRRDRDKHLISVAKQLYRFTYPFWGVEYRRIQCWRYALGVYLGLRPTRLANGLALSHWAMIRLWLMYVASGLLALSVPIRLFDAVRPRLYAFAKRLRSTG